MDGTPARRRDETLDAARGLAVLLMIWVHFVPDDGPWTELWALDALPAALFTMLVGVSAAVGPARSARRLLGRVATLCCVGLPFWVWVWGNDILLPIACMSVAVASCRGRPRRTWGALALVCVAVPFATELWGGYAWTDVRADGTHEANHSWGWHTLRYFFLDGAYPLLPWVALPLLGLRFAAARRDRARLRRWLIGGACAAVVGLGLDRFGDAGAAGLPVHLDVTWQPTSLPFLLLWGGAASASLAALYLGGFRSRAVAGVGRWSLQHYLAHITLIFWPMTCTWPDEDWSWGTGAAVAVGYAAVALTWAKRRGQEAASG
ncbi:MAG: heparan-alpha-glucosaminide N-acetyltransferase domain-containing protein [Planctomycetota bacterium]